MQTLDAVDVFIGTGAATVAVPVSFTIARDRVTVDYWLSTSHGGGPALPALRRRVWLPAGATTAPMYQPYLTDIRRAFPALARGRGSVRAFLVVAYAGAPIASGIVRLFG